MADNNTVSISSSGASVQGGLNVTDPTAGTFTIPINVRQNLVYTAGSGAQQVNGITQGQLVLAANSACTINFNTGAITGSQTTTINNNTATSLLEPDGTTFTTSAVKIFLIALQDTPGSASAALFPGASNGWSSMLGSGTTFPLRGGAGGGTFSDLCSDSIGWPVSSSLANLVLNNVDPSNAATFQFCFGGN